MIIVFLAGSCTKELELVGAITGSVELYSPYNGTPENVMVVIENEHFRAETYTNKKGIFLFSKVPDGYYTITFSYEGFETYIKENYAFIGFGKMAVIDQVSLYPKYNFKFQEAHLTLSSGINGYAVVDGFLTCPQGSNNFDNVVLFFDKTPDVTNEKYRYATGYSIYKRVKGDTIFVRDFIHDLPKGEEWYAGIYSFRYATGNLYNKAFEPLKLTVK